jgi:lysyl-tRNA synthetase class 2
VTDQPTRPEQPTDADDLPEQMRVRLDKRARLLEQGMDQYPTGVRRSAGFAELLGRHADLAPDTTTGEHVEVAGRVIFLRNTGKLCFARLREGDGSELQAMLSLDRVGREGLDSWKALVDIGDLVAVTGEVVSSRRASCPSLPTSGASSPRRSGHSRSSTARCRRRPGSASGTRTSS